MSTDGKKINGTKDVIKAAEAAERGVSEQKKQEIFEAYTKLREEMLAESENAVPQMESSAKPQARILTLAALCRRASMAAAAIAVFGLLFFAVGRIAKRAQQTDGETQNGEDTATVLQFTEVIDFDTSRKSTPGVTRPVEQDDSLLMAGLDFTAVQELSGDRAAVTADWILRPYRDAEWDGGAQALCLVTLQGIDLKNVSGEQGTHAPLTIRIDRIYHSTADFAQKENDILTTQDRSFWFLKEGGYALNHPQEEVPMTEIGAQYIVTIAKFDDATYSVSAHTIPIDGQSRVVSGDYGPLVWGTVQLGNGENALVPREKLYERMALGDDVAHCSEELIRMFIETP